MLVNKKNVFEKSLIMIKNNWSYILSSRILLIYDSTLIQFKGELVALSPLFFCYGSESLFA